MPVIDYTTLQLRGVYRDILRDPQGRVIWKQEWTSNTIVNDCRRLLAAFIHGAPTTSMGIQGLLVGAGSESWDASGPSAPSGTETQLVDPNPYLVSGAPLQLEYLQGNTVSVVPTNRVQIEATLGPNIPNWPDANHLTGNLREFGLVAELGGSPVLINYVTHAVIAKDPTSTLERTIWLIF